MGRHCSRNCYNCLYFPYHRKCDICDDIKLSKWEQGSFDFKPAFMSYTRYIPDYYESEDSYEIFR